ncbi:MAG: MGMT family protein [Solirubrobacterales bacterium]|nr:MGMT family protein [Solirubrobacterales bacterium]
MTGAARPDRLDGRASVGTPWGTLCLEERGGVIVRLVVGEGLDPTGVEPDPGGGRASALAGEVDRRIREGEDFEGIPFEASGTPFQERVWGELTRIPRGEVVTYGELARRVGSPGAARAVGSACGANPVSLLIPCHRVIASDGSLGGFRWGAVRKAKILGSEGVDLVGPPLRQAA